MNNCARCRSAITSFDRYVFDGEGCFHLSCYLHPAVQKLQGELDLAANIINAARAVVSRIEPGRIERLTAALKVWDAQ